MCFCISVMLRGLYQNLEPVKHLCVSPGVSTAQHHPVSISTGFLAPTHCQGLSQRHMGPHMESTYRQMMSYVAVYVTEAGNWLEEVQKVLVLCSNAFYFLFLWSHRLNIIRFKGMFMQWHILPEDNIVCLSQEWNAKLTSNLSMQALWRLDSPGNARPSTAGTGFVSPLSCPQSGSPHSSSSCSASSLSP